MADVEITYQNNTIVELSESGTKTLKTAGKYCEDDITLSYTRPAGGSTPEPEPVYDPDGEYIRFYDYDGTLVEYWTLEELQEKSTLPETPTHTGLTFQGWNWSLSDLKTINRVMDVGATYVPTDGKTHIFIDLTGADPSKCTVPLYFSQTVANGVTIDWGDGSSTETVSGTGNKSASHVYSVATTYEITMEVASGCTMGLGRGSSGYALTLVVDGATSTPDRGNPGICYAVWIGSGVTAIGSYAFQRNVILRKITIPVGVTSIADYAFYMDGVLQCVVIPSGVTTIGQYAFHRNDKLYMVSFPNSVTSIGNYAFSESAVTTCYLGENVTTIGNYVWQSCWNLRHAYISDSATSVGTYAYNACYNLRSVHLSTSMTTLGDHFLYDARSLESLTIPNSVTTWSSNALYNCAALKEITIGSGIKTIPDNALSYCTDLEEIVVPDTVTKIGASAFRYCHNLKSLEIGAGVTSIGGYVCYVSRLLRSLTIKGSLSTQNTGYLFQSCTALTDVDLGTKLTSLSSYFLKYNASIEVLTIPATVTSIAAQALGSMAGLRELHFKRSTPPTVSNANAFYDLQPYCKIYVPTGALSAYTSATNYPSSSNFTYVEESDS